MKVVECYYCGEKDVMEEKLLEIHQEEWVNRGNTFNEFKMTCPKCNETSNVKLPITGRYIGKLNDSELEAVKKKVESQFRELFKDNNILSSLRKITEVNEIDLQLWVFRNGRLVVEMKYYLDDYSLGVFDV